MIYFICKFKFFRLPNNDRVIVAVSEPESSEDESSEESGESNQEMGMQYVEQPRPTEAPTDMDLTNRQAYMRRLPVNIPVNMMQQQVPDAEEPQAVASEETRPHCKFLTNPILLT